MSNSIIETINVINTGRGRKVGKDTLRVRRAVVRVISKTDGQLTTNDVAKECKQSKVRVIAALRWLEQKGFVKKVGSEKVKKDRAGRPSAVWAIDPEYNNIDKTKQAYVQAKRKYIREVSAKSPEDRYTMVAIALNMLSERQTEDEVEDREAKYTNAQGFIKADAKRGVEDAMKDKLTLGDVNYWIIRIYKYRKQLGMD